MSQTMTISEARSQLLKLAKHKNETVVVTKRNKPVLAILHYDLFEALTETIEIMSDPEALGLLRKGIRDMEAGRVIPMEKVHKELGLE